MTYRFPSQLFAISDELSKEVQVRSLTLMLELEDRKCNHLEMNPPYPVKDEDFGKPESVWFSSRKLEIIICDNSDLKVVIPGFDSNGVHCMDFPVMWLDSEAYFDLQVVPAPCFNPIVAVA